VHGLACLDGQLAALEIDHDGAAQHDGELAELRALPRFGPAGRAAHPGDAQRRLAGAGAAHEFVDQLRRLTCGRHPAGFADQFRHARQYPALRRATAHRARAASSGGRGWAVTSAPAERRAGICHDGRMESPFEVRVRPARLADRAALTALEAIAWSAESGFPSTMAADQRNATFFDAGNPPEAFLVGELDGRVVGYIRLKPPTKLPENAHVIQVQGLAVHPDARRRGVAAVLLDAAEETLRQRGIRKLTLRVLSTNEVAIRLYERHGFVREGTLLEEFRINGRFVDDVMMAKKL
jgi:ribosomal protein S18 acetylase RimI-like enzyme